MTKHAADEIEGWEFKIVHASTRKLNDPESFCKTCEEEARAGWEMLEKFDDSPVRFSRKIEHRDGDLHRDIDPYRTLVGMTHGSSRLFDRRFGALGNGCSSGDRILADQPAMTVAAAWVTRAIRQ